MSTESDALAMWNYYSKGNGYCIKFKKSKLFKKYTSDDLIPDITREEKLVNYDYDSQLENIKAILNKYILMIPKSEELKQNLKRCREQGNEIEFTKYSNLITDIESSFMDELYANRFLYKHPAYEREHEIRIVSQHEEESVYQKKFRSTDSGQLIEYIELPINLDNISEIMIHPLISNDVHKIGLKRYLSNQGLSYIKVTPSLIPFRNL
jgi:aromatic ring-cleaving dioxygenase